MTQEEGEMEELPSEDELIYEALRWALSHAEEGEYDTDYLKEYGRAYDTWDKLRTVILAKRGAKP
jgi:anaerobic selenocysteine-containing dehydrogenase